MFAMMSDSEQSKQVEPPEAPEGIKLVRWAVHHVRENAEVLIKGPVIVAVLLVAGAAYYFGKSVSSEEISVQKERISFLGDQVSAYKDRLQGATPDQAAKQIASLQNRVEAYEQKLQFQIGHLITQLNLQKY